MISSNKTKYRPYLDNLRSIAVISVILYHLFPEFFTGGFIGVDIFFVISGFIVTKTFLKSDFSNLREGIQAFFLRRITRILPALIFLFITVTIISTIIIPPEQSYKYLISGAYSLFGLSNIYFTREASDYFNFASTMNPFTHTWSLGVEEQFYLLLPILIIGVKYRIQIKYDLIIKFFTTFNSNKSILFYIPFIFLPFITIYLIGYVGLVNSLLFLILAFIITIYILIFILPNKVFLLLERQNKINNYYFYLLLIFTFLSLCLSLYLSYFSTINAYYSILSRFWELSLGVILCIILKDYKYNGISKFIENFYYYIVLFFLFTFALYLFVINKESSFPLPFGSFPVFSTLILIFLSETSKVKDIYFNRSSLFSSFGKISYSAYLWHWPILIFTKWYFIEQDLFLVVVYVLIVFLFSLLSYFFVERKYGQYNTFLFINLSPIKIFIIAFFLGVSFSQFKISSNTLNNFFIFSSMEKKFPINVLKDAKCHGLEWNEMNLKNCLLNKKNFKDADSIYLFGDSHALNHLPMITSFAEEKNLNFSYMTGGPFLVGNGKNELNFIQKYVSNNDVVILTIHRTYFYDVGKRLFIRDYKDLNIEDAVKKTTYFSDIVEKNLKSIIDQLLKKNAKLLLIHDTPVLGFNIVSACMMQKIINGFSLCKIPKELSEIHRMPMEKLFTKIANENDNVFAWDPHDFLCEQNSCTYSISNNINYFDGGHLTKSGSLFLKNYFNDFVKIHDIFR